MPGDYTRMTFRPRDNHAGVLMQQGRVQLDADWNELVELVDRRFRAGTADIMGRCAVPRESPDGFRIEAAGGTLMIAPGRAYADGLLAENHGAGPLAFDPVLAEPRGTAPVRYDEQPYLPGAPELPGGGPHLVYLDVWQREVTHVQDPELVEKAIGFDTAARLQTVWQVRLLEDVGEGADCASELEAWDELTRPPAARLTTRAVGTPTSEDPCVIPPAGGYRGTENRLYRVEVHEGGPLGTATFKWSADNASIASVVTEIDASATRLTLVRLGRDAVRRFRPGDWVEVTDDRRELAGQAGELRQVAEVDEVARTLELSAALPAGAFDAADPGRHTRVRRWDQTGAAVDAVGGVMTVPAGGPASPVLLEQDGVEIAFDVEPPGGELRTGDYWVFAARTADASVEELTREPPRGIHHHYCRLAVVTFPDEATDCRVLWPPEAAGPGCDCTVCVTPESHASGELTLQAAVDSVRADGGKVCLQPGAYRLEQPLRIAAARSLRLQGKGWKTMLVSDAPAAIVVDGSVGVAIEDLAIVAASARRRGEKGLTGIAIALRNSIATAIERCLLLQTGLVVGGRDRILAAGGEAFRAALGELRTGGGPLIALDGMTLMLRVRDNVLAGTAGLAMLAFPGRAPIGAGGAEELRLADRAKIAEQRRYALTYDLVVSGNVMACASTGISLEGFAFQLGETRLEGNRIAGCARAGVAATGVVGPGSRLDVTCNALGVRGDGIVIGSDSARVAGNDVGPPPGERDREAAAGAGILLRAGLRPTAIDRCMVTGNRIAGRGGDAIAIATRLESALVSGNVVEDVAGGGVVMREGASAGTLTIDGNQVLGVADVAGEDGSAAGIRVLTAREAVIVGNTVAGVGRGAVEGARRVGIEVSATRSVRIAGNDVVDVGPADEFVKLGAGIAVLSAVDRVEVLDNMVRRTREPVEEPGASAWVALLIRELEDVERAVAVVTLARREEAEPVPFSTFAAEAFSPTLVVDEQRAVVLPRGRGLVAVAGNTLAAHGSAPCLMVATDGACQLNGNRCLLVGTGRVAVARVTCGAAIAGDNYLEGREGANALELLVPDSAPFTVVGNIASGPIEVNGAPLAAPWAPLNAF